MKKITVIALAFLALGCTQQDKAQRLLTSQGYTNIEMTGYRFFSCGRDDTYHDGFKATSPVGQPTEGTVCTGMFFKGSTIRFD